MSVRAASTCVCVHKCSVLRGAMERVHKRVQRRGREEAPPPVLSPAGLGFPVAPPALGACFPPPGLDVLVGAGPGRGQGRCWGACTGTRVCALLHPTLCQSPWCVGCPDTPQDPRPFGSSPGSPEAAAGRTGCLRPRGWHRAPRAGEVPAFLVRLQVEQWAGARGGDAAALSVHPCVSALGHPWDTPSHTPCCPTSPPEPHTGIAPRPWHRLGFSRTPAGCQPCPHPPCKQDGADTLGLCPGGALTA